MMPTVRDKPGLRESIAFLKAMLTEQIEVITAEVIDDHLGFIARGADDLTNLELGPPATRKGRSHVRYGNRTNDPGSLQRN